MALVECKQGDQDCVTFEIGDINALEAEVFFDAERALIGARCGTKPQNIPRDKYGRIVRNGTGCHGLNAGSLLVVLGNRLKRDHLPIAIDAQTPFTTAQIWNQPAYRYLVNAFAPITKDDVIKLVAKAPAEKTQDAQTSALTQTVDQAGIDAQVLQIWTTGKFFPMKSENRPPLAKGDSEIDGSDPAVCPTLAALPSLDQYEDRQVDCADALANAAPFDLTNKTGPIMGPARFTMSKRLDDGFTLADPDYCNRVEVRVLVRDAALSQPSFAGIGFSTSRGESFTKKADLQKVGHARLANGDDATVMRFSGLSICVSGAHNSTSGNTYQTFAFKPYAAFDAGGTRYRVWENIRGDHMLGRSWPDEQPAVNSTGFDREELLSH